MNLLFLFRIVQYSGFVLAWSMNSFLLYLLFFKTPTRIGQYLNLMIVFKTYCFCYAFVEILTQPVIHPTHSGIILYCDSFFYNHRNVGTYLSVIYCGGFGLCIILLTSLFVYKFIVIVRPDKLELIKGARLVVLFIPSVIIGFLWSVGLKLAASPSDQLDMSFGNAIKIHYNESISEIGYIAAYFYVIDSKGISVPNYSVYAVCCLMSITMLSSILTIIYCAFRTYFKLDHTWIMSARTKQMHQQLLLTLVIQAAIPFATMFVPVFTLIILTTMSVYVGIYANLVAAFAAIYPGLAPMVSLFLVSDFRNIILGRVTSKIGSTITTVERKSSRI